MSKDSKKFVNFGNLVLKKDGKYAIKLDTRNEIRINGEKVTSGYINAEAPLEKFNRMLEKQKISQEEYNQRVEEYSKGGKFEYVRLDLQVTMDNNDI